MREGMDKLLRYRLLAKYTAILPGFIHNMNTPLMSISGRIELIKFKHPDIQGVDQILSQLEKINDMISDLNSMLSKDNQSGPEEIAVNKLIDQLDRFFYFNMTYKHKIELEREIEENLHFRANPFLLANALYEIINNAVAAMENGGKIRIKVWHEEANIRFIIQRNGSQLFEELIAKVNDDTDYELVTENFVDLLIIKKIMKEMGGLIRVKNSENGVEYHLTLPV
jgi:signal transduction histidine kinase